MKADAALRHLRLAAHAIELARRELAEAGDGQDGNSDDGFARRQIAALRRLVGLPRRPP